jgi:hypothetical protein
MIKVKQFILENMNLDINWYWDPVKLIAKWASSRGLVVKVEDS